MDAFPGTCITVLEMAHEYQCPFDLGIKKNEKNC